MRSKLADLNTPKITLPGAELGYSDAVYSSTFSGGWTGPPALTCWIPDTGPLLIEAGGGYVETPPVSGGYVFSAFLVDGTLTGAGGDTSNYQSFQVDAAIASFFVNSYKAIRIPGRTVGVHTFQYAFYMGGGSGTILGGSSGYDKFWIRVSKC